MENDLQQQTETFWLIQLQLLELDVVALVVLFMNYKQLGRYVKTTRSGKVDRIMDRATTFGVSVLDDSDRQCLATHLALQLAGIEA
jgi:hypothetical protein